MWQGLIPFQKLYFRVILTFEFEKKDFSEKCYQWVGFKLEIKELLTKNLMCVKYVMFYIYIINYNIKRNICISQCIMVIFFNPQFDISKIIEQSSFL